MKRSLKVTITKVQRREVVSTMLETLYVHCQSCGREVVTLSPTLATKMLDLQGQTIDDLAAAGQIHIIQVANGTYVVCSDSLFATYSGIST